MSRNHRPRDWRAIRYYVGGKWCTVRTNQRQRDYLARCVTLGITADEAIFQWLGEA
jgi:hypothetical protein